MVCCGFLDKKVVCCVCFASSSVIIAFVATRQLCRSAIRTNTPCGVRQVACHVQVVSLLSFLGPPWCQWCSDWCALGCSAAVAFGCVCSSHVSGWLTSVEVFAVIPPGMSCFQSCWVGEILCGPSERWGAGRLLHPGIRIQAAPASCARLVFWRSGASGTGAHSVYKKSTFFGVFTTSAALLSAVVKGLNILKIEAREVPDRNAKGWNLEGGDDLSAERTMRPTSGQCSNLSTPNTC